MLISDAEQADLISALESIIRRITDPADCARRIFNALDEALADDFGIDRVAALLDSETEILPVTFSVPDQPTEPVYAPTPIVAEPLPAEIAPQVRAGIKAYREGRVVKRERP